VLTIEKRRKIVSALPANFLLAPEMMGFGMSVAGVALADDQSEADRAADRVRHSIRRLRTVFEECRPRISAYEGTFSSETDEQLREFLVATGALDRGLQEGAEIIGQALSPNFQARMNALANGTIFSDIQAIIKEIRADYIPAIRRVHLLTIKGIYRRALEAGIEEARLPEDFEETLVNAIFSEVEGWHETAYLMCDLDYLRSLTRVSFETTNDRTADFSEISGASSP
jgi:hypothetical protein